MLCRKVGYSIKIFICFSLKLTVFVKYLIFVLVYLFNFFWITIKAQPLRHEVARWLGTKRNKDNGTKME